jgi:hypothetical protein
MLKNIFLRLIRMMLVDKDSNHTKDITNLKGL